MTRMTREFSLVLVGATALTAGYMMLPEPNLEKRAEEQAASRVGGRSHGHGIVWIHSYGYNSASTRPVGLASVSRGGFGSIGGRVGGGVGG